ncbi:uncharacterized protein [Halyomorpha halys]|uniref:uncharacterized protein n=1 Tax=Halyomorpha halys TaxID=286706 RepID=UPI0006D4F615|nr:uncharacterized protein LOC106682399 [Halyomorpha halys]
MDKDVLERVIKSNWKETSLKKVISIESVPAVGKNLNFLSSVERLNLKVVLGNGRVVKKSLIRKVLGSDANEFQTEFNGKYNPFKTETEMYNSLTQIEYLMEEFEDTEDVLWCKMVHHIPYNYIVMEDLKAMGFHMIERVQFYDLDHILLSVHSLGRYHAMCKTLEGRGLTPLALKTWYLFDNQGMHEYMYYDLIALAAAVKRLWDPKWTPIVDKIKTTKSEVHERLKKFSEIDETKFNVTNHGDCHKNNIVIKYNWDQRPIAMRFLDFQLVHYGSPCIDLTYMLYLAADPSVRRDNFNLLLITYHNALVTTLDKYHFQGKKPDIEEIRDGMEKHSFMGLILSLSWYPNLLKSERMEELRDFVKIGQTEGLEGYADENFYPDDLEKAIGPDIKDFVNRFCKDS